MLRRVLLLSALAIFAFAYPAQKFYESGCGCCCQEDPTTTTTPAPALEEPCCSCCCGGCEEPPTTTTTTTATPALAPEPCCCCCQQQQDPITTTTTTTTTTTEPPTEDPCCCCGYGKRAAVQDPVPIAVGPAPAMAPIPSYEVHGYDSNFIEEVCPSGWRRFGESCYYVEMNKLDFDTAEKKCFEKGATMFAADTIDEWNEVMSFTPLYFWTWTGIIQENEGEGAYVKGGQLDASRVNWLVKMSSSAANGWSMLSKCTAYYNMDLVAANYVYFYPCSYQYYSICEKNLGRR